MQSAMLKNQSSLEIRIQKWWRLTRLGQYFAFFAVMAGSCLGRVMVEYKKLDLTNPRELITPVSQSSTGLIAGVICLLCIYIYSTIIAKKLPAYYRDRTFVHLFVASILGALVGMMLIKYWSYTSITQLKSI